MTYEQGFAAGETQAWIDRQEGKLERYAPEPENEWERGFWDAYIPRTAKWAGNAWKKDETPVS